MGNDTSSNNTIKDPPDQSASADQTQDPSPDTIAQAVDDKPNITDETKEALPSVPLDVAFVLDCTGSMSSYIQSCKENIIAISNKISTEIDNCEVQFGLVCYRDIPPEDHTFITKVFPFTPIPFQIQLELEQMSATGGGDHPEALTSALYECAYNLQWRDGSIKVIIAITDAPPHGLEKGSDGFPNGDPDTFNGDKKEGESDQIEGQKDDKAPVSNKHLNVIDIVRDIRNNLKAAIYTVACEPALSCSAEFANDFMQYLAESTKGRFLPLSSAKLLPEVIVGSVKQQINLDQLSNRLQLEIAKIKAEHGNNISGAELNKLIAEKWKDAGIKKKEISIGTLYRTKRSRANIELLMNEQKVKSLQDFKRLCVKLPRIKRSDFRHLDKDKRARKYSDSASVFDDDDDDDDDSSSDADSLSNESEDDSDSDGSSGGKKKRKRRRKKRLSRFKVAIEASADSIRVNADEAKEEEEEEEGSRSRPGPGLFGDDDDDDDLSDSCASQMVYSRSVSLDCDDVENMMVNLD